MLTSLMLVGLCVVLLACFPLALNWAKKRYSRVPHNGYAQSKVVSAMAVGPTQKVVTVEVGPSDAKVWLVLGVTAQSITCLHTLHSAHATTHSVDTHA